jgi:hypothetical protein
MNRMKKANRNCNNVIDIAATPSLRQHFLSASSFSDDIVTILFLDKCDALVSVDLVAAMLASLLDDMNNNNYSDDDDNNKNHHKKKKLLIVVGVTNHIDSIPTILQTCDFLLKFLSSWELPILRHSN